MKTFNLTGGTDGRITESGEHTVEITQAKAVTSTKGTKGIQFDFKSDDGLTLRFLKLYLERSDGSSIGPSITKLREMTAICSCEADALESTSAQCHEKNFSTGAVELVTCDTYPQLYGVMMRIKFEKTDRGWNILSVNPIAMGPLPPSDDSLADVPI